MSDSFHCCSPPCQSQQDLTNSEPSSQDLPTLLSYITLSACPKGSCPWATPHKHCPIYHQILVFELPYWEGVVLLAGLRRAEQNYLHLQPRAEALWLSFFFSMSSPADRYRGALVIIKAPPAHHLPQRPGRGGKWDTNEIQSETKSGGVANSTEQGDRT